MKSAIKAIIGSIFIAMVVSITVIAYFYYGDLMTSDESEFRKAIHSTSTPVPGALPGVGVYSQSLQDKIAEMQKARGDKTKPRTRHLDNNGKAIYTNRLFLESSPYLLQHAHNPVNWFPWGEEAFQIAEKLNRPVLLSVGYSTCHWCHVMEEESFEDIEIANYLNQHYIAIKVDREERPDVDALYMEAVQALTGRGGWPMTVWLTAKKEPFYGGTYFPARDNDRYGQVGFLTLLKRLHNVYSKYPDKIQAQSKQMVELLQKSAMHDFRDAIPSEELFEKTIAYFQKKFDSVHGGVKSRMKFPSSMPICFLLHYYRRQNDNSVLHMAQLTLDKMGSGGIYDHIGGGFHRYSTDPEWLVPHFEKMLYDNALLVMAYLEGYQSTQDKRYQEIVTETLNYIQKEMTSPTGGFCSATDADSLTPNGHREEGYYFTWSPDEIDTLLSKQDAEWFKAFYGVTAKGNFEGRTILTREKAITDIAKDLKIPKEKLKQKIADAKELLYKARQKRPAPLRDDKIITAWNGLMISAFARAAFTLDNPEWLATAESAANDVLQNAYANNLLLRSFKDKEKGGNAFSNDYAFFIAGLLDLYEASFDMTWLTQANTLQEQYNKLFYDDKKGAFFMTSDDEKVVISRLKPMHDGAIPSANSVAILNLLRLNEYFTNDAYRKQAEQSLETFSKLLDRHPHSLTEMLLALDFYHDKTKEIILVYPNNQFSQAKPFITHLRQHYLPNRVTFIVEENDNLKNLEANHPLLRNKKALNNKATAYVCEAGHCELPTNDPDDFLKQITKVTPLNQGKDS